jgi:hypothetical protein
MAGPTSMERHRHGKTGLAVHALTASKQGISVPVPPAAQDETLAVVAAVPLNVSSEDYDDLKQASRPNNYPKCQFT